MQNQKLAEHYTNILLLALPVVSAWLFIPQLSNAFGIKHHFAIITSLLLVLLLAANGMRNSLYLPKSVIGIAMLLWTAALLTSAAYAENAYLVVNLFFESAIFLLLALSLLNLQNKDSALHTLETGIIVAGTGVALFALKQYLFPGFLDPGFHALGKMKVYSTLGNSNLAAIIILAAVPSSAWRTCRGSVTARSFYSLNTLILLTGLIATQARHALLALGIALIVALLWLGSAYVRKIVMAALASVTIIGATALLFIDIPPSVTHSVYGRLFIWITSLSMLADHPLSGVGLGHFGLNHMAYQSTLFSTGQYNSFFDNASVISEGHNDFLNWGAMTGVLGLTGFTMLCVAVAWKGWHSARLKQHAPQLYLAFASYTVAMFFVAVTSYTVPALFFWVLLGMVLAYADLPKLEWRPRVWLRYTFAAALVLLLAVACFVAWRNINSEWHTAQGDQRMEEHDLWLAGKEYQQALLWDKHNSAAMKKHATVLFLEGNLPSAIAELEVAQRYSGDLGLRLLEGEIRTRLGDLEHAANLYRQITSAFPNMISPHFILGQIYQLQGQQTHALEEFKKVLDIRPSPFNLNMTAEKVEIQKQIVRDYLQETLKVPASAVSPKNNRNSRE